MQLLVVLSNKMNSIFRLINENKKNKKNLEKIKSLLLITLENISKFQPNKEIKFPGLSDAYVSSNESIKIKDENELREAIDLCNKYLNEFKN